MPDAFDNATLLPGDPETDPLIGSQIRDFHVLERIGRGGMGTVYKAEHLLLREPRALKVMRAELFQAVPNAVERFQREARIAVKLRHPNLVLLYDFFVERGDHFLVMEYVVGKSLAALLRECGTLSVREACRIGIQCCAGMAHAHGMGIVHRDLSPENVMLAPSPAGMSVKIIDFGVARAVIASRGQGWVGADAALTGADEFLGKPRYCSPEQARRRRGEAIDQRSDLYTLGLILYEMVTGTSPFQSDTSLGYLSLHANQPPTPPTQLRPDLAIPAGLEQVILRCLEKDREYRFASASELGAALEWALRSGDPRDAPFAWEQRRASQRTRRWPVVPIAAGAALAVVAAGTAALWGSGRREAVAPAPIVPEVAVTPALPEPAEPAPEAPLAPREEPAESVLHPPPEEPAPAPRATEPAPEPRVERAPPRADPTAAAFADAAEMQRAFDDALAFEGSHDPSAAIASWKRFRSRSPSRDLDEQAKRRITELTLRNLQEFP
jgi:serine/threonine-protein kinase